MELLICLHLFFKIFAHLIVHFEFLLNVFELVLVNIAVVNRILGRGDRGTEKVEE